MFNPDILGKLARANQSIFQDLARVEEMLNARFSGLQEPIRCLILSVASGEPLLLIGPPGTAKSKLIRAFCGLIGLIDEENLGSDHPDYFEYLLTPFTEPGELFGFYNIAAARANRLEREDKGMMQNARVVYLDEVFNGSSAILNSILAFINERIFHDRGVRKPVAMQCLFAATNQIPETSDLRAVFDRFVLRCPIENVEAHVEPVGALLRAGWVETFGRKKRPSELDGMLTRMETFRNAVRELTSQGQLTPQIDAPFFSAMAQMVQHARQYDLSQMSNRRLVKLSYVMLVHRLYEAVREGDFEQIRMRENELQLLPRYFLDRSDEEAVQKMRRVVLR
ncbi:MAG: AAA family ATPase [Acidobacteriota bacterium]|nr:AAA family ATPase [Acidobacteriota bacterium]